MTSDWGGGTVSFQGTHQALIWVSILGLRVLVGADQKLEVVSVKVTTSQVTHTRAR